MRSRTEASEGQMGTMETPKLTITSMKFSEYDLRAWKEGDYSLVEDCGELLRERLREKASSRRKKRPPDRRFFGEAYVLAKEAYQEGWYGSFMWLTAEKWSGRQKLKDRYKDEFRNSLLRHFPNLRDFQRWVTTSMCSLGRKKPRLPDLWLITSDRHRFIEVKLPGDQPRDEQLFGLALIAMFLPGDRPVSVEIVHLYQEKKPLGSDQVKHKFQEICTRLKEVPKYEGPS